MFGYIRAEKPEMKIREYDTYKAVYCTLCKVMGKRYTPLLRFTLSYDFAFLAMLNCALSDEQVEYEKKRCTCNPLKKCVYCKDVNAFYMPSAAAVIMLYYKLCDNIADEGFFKKIGFFILKLVYFSSHKKAAKEYPLIEKTVKDYIEKQSQIEAQKSGDIDKAADPTSYALGKIFELCSEDDTQKRILNRLGYCIGRYIYILDAAADYNTDKKRGSYNPLIYSSQFSGESTEFKPQLQEKIMLCAIEAQRAYELLPIKRYKTILDNILYLGLESVQNKEIKL